MKKIEAIIRTSKCKSVREALHSKGINFLSYWNVTGIGNESKDQIYRGVTYNTEDIQRRYLSIIVNDEFEEIAISTIMEHSKTGVVGDGKIFVSEISNAYRIRTGEKGEETLK